MTDAGLVCTHPSVNIGQSQDYLTPQKYPPHSHLSLCTTLLTFLNYCHTKLPFPFYFSVQFILSVTLILIVNFPLSFFFNKYISLNFQYYWNSAYVVISFKKTYAYLKTFDCSEVVWMPWKLSLDSSRVQGYLLLPDVADSIWFFKLMQFSLSFSSTSAASPT